MKKYIEITCDYNDADYLTKRNFITEDKIELIKPVIEEIKKVKEHNFPTSEFSRKKLSDLYPELYREDEDGDIEALTESSGLFFDLVPYGEHGVHTIISIKILEVVNETKLL